MSNLQKLKEQLEKEFDEKFDNEDFPWADTGTIMPVKKFISHFKKHKEII